MAGHSKWNNIKRTKGLQDAKKGSLFSKISKEITVASRMGGGADLETNSLLRFVVNKAKLANMTSEKIQKAIDKGVGGTSESLSHQEKTYEIRISLEGYLLVDCESDNPNRTFTEIRTLVTKAGFKLVNEGASSWRFEHIGKIEIQSKSKDIALELINIEGVVDIEESGDSSLIIFTAKEAFNSVLNSIKDRSSELELIEFSLIKRAKDLVELEEDLKHGLGELILNLEEFPEVVSIWSNIKNIDL